MLILSNGIRQEFQGSVPAETHILGFVYFPHPPRTEPPQKAIMGDNLAKHGTLTDLRVVLRGVQVKLGKAKIGAREPGLKRHPRSLSFAPISR
jgi:hypothetical protein